MGEKIDTSPEAVERAVEEFERAVRDEVYSHCTPMGAPGHYHKVCETDELRTALHALIRALSAERSGFAATVAQMERELKEARKRIAELEQIRDKFRDREPRKYKDFGGAPL